MNDVIVASEKRDSALLALLDALVGCHGRVGTAEVLGVNYRTLKGSVCFWGFQGQSESVQTPLPNGTQQ